MSDFLEIAKSFGPGLALAFVVIVWGAEEIKKMKEELLQAKAKIQGAWGTACVIAVIVSALATIAVELLKK